ncbi:MAG TPA: hypothetical protein VFC37_19540 [Terracidiphilus sp.]|nr:hypothetical protein [Terracidiphilus sp.]
MNRKKNSINTAAPSSFMGELEQVFGDRTPILRERDIKTLRAMAVAAGKDSEYGKCYAALADAVEKYEEIQISAEY